MLENKGLAVMVAVFMVLGMAAVETGAVIPPHQKLMAKRAAELDAYRNMAERIMGLRVTSSSMVSNFVGESDRIRTSMDHFIKGLRIDDEQTAWYDDGSCEVVVEVTLAKVISELQKSCDAYYNGEEWTRQKFEKMTSYTTERVLTEYGAAQVRPESVIADPQETPIFMQPTGPRDRHIELPEIYQKYPAKNRLMAVRIARVDAYRKLVERIYGMHITANTTVRDIDVNFSEDRIRTSLDHTLRGMKVEDVRYQPDGIVEVQVSLTLKQVISTLKHVCDEYYSETGKKIKTEKFTEIEKQTKRRTVTALGMGAITGEGTATETSGSFKNDQPETGRVRKTEVKIIEESPEVIEIK